MIVSGFNVGPGSGETILLRAVGPTLGAAPFNISGVLPDPVLTLFNGSNTQIATNSSWGTVPNGAAIMSSVGAFPLTPGSKDAAIVTSLASGCSTPPK